MVTIIYIYNLVILVEVSIIIRMGIEFELSVKDSTKTDMTGKQSDISLHFVVFMNLA